MLQQHLRCLAGPHSARHRAGAEQCCGADRDKAAWTQLSPHGWDISKDGWLEHRVREMCNELRPEVSIRMGSPTLRHCCIEGTEVHGKCNAFGCQS